MNKYLERTKQLVGDEKLQSLSDKVILVVGVGGVGGTALEALARSGFKKFVLVDSDVVDETNLNRQILFTSEDIGLDKVVAAKKRLLKINNDFNVAYYKIKIGEKSFNDLELPTIDFIVDAIDDIEGKLAIYKFAIDNNIPFISSLGMGNRLNPEDVFVTKLNQTTNDPLARKLRYEAKARGLDLSKINVVFSKEIPLVKSPKPASMIMVPSTAGLIIAKYVLTTIL